ncbi:thiol reductant ABC exporter subunit CydC [Alkalihalobacterium chitinilyticum]|uniref:Thiol reductant ABC exporter subunit CydC n=1 Tax=Alkalihalobacterium chitinilyticum TaxID=2980103 RepID=A0ABT5VH67_9BACI|nr:thiol reductant ABC exporter subunit CydC [Alkalihalobacterium chitinilyticum]MDE5414802.1 thiol reductant ABC exporter subunit CydC [Alkalihalobacterium chitinilyticum]
MNELLNTIRIIMLKKKDVILSIVFAYIAGITAVGLFAANGYLISKAALQPPLYVLLIMVAVVKIGSILRATSRYGERYYSHRATFTMLSDLRVHFFDRLEKLAPSLLTKYRSGDLLARIVGDVESLQNFFLRVLYPPIIMVTVFLSTILFVSFYSLAIVILLTIGLILTGVLIPAWFAYKQKKVSNRMREERGHLSTEVTEWFHGFREFKIHQTLEDKEQQLVAASNAYIQEDQQAGQHSLYNQSINTAVSLMIVWAVLAVGAYSVANGSLDGLFLAMLVMVSLTVFDHSTPMAAFPVYYEESERAATRLGAVVKEDDQSMTSTVEMRSFPSGAPSIELKGVHLTFPGEKRKTLSDVNLYLPAGSKTAVVGPSGSGKSTLLSLMLKLQTANEGKLLISGTNVNEFEPESVWKNSNVILQENHFFHGTVKENLLLASNDLTDEDLKQLLVAVQLPHLELSDTVFEKGQNLSGGERQRLAMARAVAKGASFWLLDEPTSSLDSWTEQRLYELLYKKAKEDTVVVVSHRLEGLEQMDQIIVMDQGKIVEMGTFTELMKAKGYFYQLKQIEKNILK